MREIKIVLGVIRQGDRYFLQFRDGDPKIGGAGKTGCFGGKIETGEEPLDAVVREIAEETSLQTTSPMWKLLGHVEVVSDHNLEDVHVHATVFICELGQEKIEAKEGRLVILAAQDIPEHIGGFTTGTRAVFEELILTHEGK